jgi:hypothetical protein
LLSIRRRTYAVATASTFAVIYSLLGLIPVSAFIGIPSFLSFRGVLSPLAGMLFGPVVGGFSMVLGTFLDFALGRPVSLAYLDFVPDLVSAAVAGLCFTGRRKAAVALPILLLAWYYADPASADFISVNGMPVPFFWMHLVSVAVIAGALFLESRGRLGRLNPAFVASTAFASTMAGHIAGSIVYENVLVRLDGVPVQTLQGLWISIFYAYPAERILFTVLCTIVSVPVLRALVRSRRTTVVGGGSPSSGA